MNKTTSNDGDVNITCFYNCDDYKDITEEELAYGHMIFNELSGILDEYSCFGFGLVDAERLRDGIQVDVEIKLKSSFLREDTIVEMTLRCHKGVVLINLYEDSYEPFSPELFWRTMYFNKRRVLLDK